MDLKIIQSIQERFKYAENVGKPKNVQEFGGGGGCSGPIHKQLSQNIKTVVQESTHSIKIQGCVNL